MCCQQCVVVGEPGSGDFRIRQGMATYILGESQEATNISNVAVKQVYTRTDNYI